MLLHGLHILWKLHERAMLSHGFWSLRKSHENTTSFLHFSETAEVMREHALPQDFQRSPRAHPFLMRPLQLPKKHRKALPFSHNFQRLQRPCKNGMCSPAASGPSENHGRIKMLSHTFGRLQSQARTVSEIISLVKISHSLELPLVGFLCV